MSLHGDDRAVTPLLGAILLAGILVLLLSVLQTQAVPAWNADVEFDHNQRVTEDLERLRSTILSVSATGTSRSVVVELGASYPPRAVLRNFAPDPAGSLTTEPAADIVVNNTSATGEAADYWNGSRRDFPTRALVYQPNYNYYDTAPVTVYETGVLYNRFGTANNTLTEQNLVDGRRITLIALNGSYSRTESGSASVRVRPVSSSEQSVTVSDSGGDPITVSIPTRLPNATWTDLLEDEYAANGGYIVDQSYRNGTPYDRLVLAFEEGVSYELRMAKVGIGTGVTGTDERYIVFVRKPDSTVVNGTSHLVTVEVRDRFNNPVSGVLANASPGDRFVDASVETGTGGEATFEYTPDAVGTDTLAFDISTTPTASEEATVSVEVIETTGDSTGPETTNVDTNVTTSSGEDVQRGTRLNLTAVVDDVGRGGTDIVEAEWWSNKTDPNGGPGSGFSLAPESGDDDEFDSSEEDVIDVSIDTSTWDLGLHNISIRGKDAAGNWGPEAHYEIDITDGTSSASVVQVVSSAKTGSNDQRVTFTVENTGASDVTIRNITVDSADNTNVDRIANGTRDTGGGSPSYTDEGPELRSNRTGSLLDNDGFGLGETQTLGSSSTIPAGQRTNYTLAEFRDSSSGGGKEVDPGTQVTITIGFSDGSEKTATLTF